MSPRSFFDSFEPVEANHNGDRFNPDANLFEVSRDGDFGDFVAWCWSLMKLDNDGIESPSHRNIKCSS